MKKIVLLAAMAALTAGFATAQTTGKDRLKELEEKQPKLEEDIKLKLVPPDPLETFFHVKPSRM